MLLSYFLSHFVSLNVLFSHLCFIVPTSAGPEDGCAATVGYFSGSHPQCFVICFQSISSCSPQNIICESSLRLKLQVNFSRDLFPSAQCLRHNQPGLQFITPFPTWGSSNHPHSVSSGYKPVWGHSRAWPLVEECLPFGIKRWDSQCSWPSLALMSTPSLCWGYGSWSPKFMSFGKGRVSC